MTLPVNAKNTPPANYPSVGGEVDRVVRARECVIDRPAIDRAQRAR